jgi:glycosyltransferase involved in cell wall biosynthesis
MNLLIVTPDLGALTETFITNHILNLKSTNTFVITSNIHNKIIDSNKILQIKLNYGPATFDDEKEKIVLDFIENKKITHILIEYGTYGSEIINLNSKHFQLPIYIHFHGYDASSALNNPIIIKYYQVIQNFISGFITVSYTMSKRLIDIGIEKDKIFVNYYGTESKIISSNVSDKINLLFVGRLVNKKNPIPILEAIAKLISKYSNIHFDIIGDGPLKDDIISYIQNNNLSNIVTLHGAQPNDVVHYFFNNCDIYVQNSTVDKSTGDREGTPVSIIEAFSHSLPVISTKHEGIEEVIIHNFNGILVNENSSEEFYQAIEFLIQNKNFRNYLGNNAKLVHSIKFDKNVSNERLIKILKNEIKFVVKPFFSVCIPTYNREKYISDTLKSVLLQNFDNYEIIIIDDGSTDNTKQIVDRFPDNRIKYYYKNHTNAADTRNLAIEKAQGEFIVWLDSDDIILPYVLQEYYNFFIQNSYFELIYGDLVIVDNFLIPQKELNYEDWYNRNNELFSKLFYGNYIPNPVVCIKKIIYEKYGKYNIDFVRAHDYEFWIRISKHIKLKKINIKTCLWRWHDSNLSAESVKIDTSYEANAIKLMLANNSLEEIFPNYDWENKDHATVKSYLEIVKRFIILKDYNEAIKYAKLAYSLAHDPSIMELVNNLQQYK